jgi:hypothetical protein
MKCFWACLSPKTCHFFKILSPNSFKRIAKHCYLWSTYCAIAHQSFWLLFNYNLISIDHPLLALWRVCYHHCTLNYEINFLRVHINVRSFSRCLSSLLISLNVMISMSNSCCHKWQDLIIIYGWTRWHVVALAW